MTPQQQESWRASQARLRFGALVEVEVEHCRQIGLEIRVVRYYLGRQDDPQFGRSADVSHEYGIQ